jgi:hypothetical protein
VRLEKLDTTVKSATGFGQCHTCCWPARNAVPAHPSAPAERCPIAAPIWVCENLTADGADAAAGIWHRCTYQSIGWPFACAPPPRSAGRLVRSRSGAPRAPPPTSRGRQSMSAEKSNSMRTAWSAPPLFSATAATAAHALNRLQARHAICTRRRAAAEHTMMVSRPGRRRPLASSKLTLSRAPPFGGMTESRESNSNEKTQRQMRPSSGGGGSPRIEFAQSSRLRAILKWLQPARAHSGDAPGPVLAKTALYLPCCPWPPRYCRCCCAPHLVIYARNNWPCSFPVREAAPIRRRPPNGPHSRKCNDLVSSRMVRIACRHQPPAHRE